MTDHERWQADLRRWATAFRKAADNSDIFEDRSPLRTVDAQAAGMQRRSDALRQTVAEMTPWWEALWD
ncbi:MAG: hypothetical protein AB7Q29_12070 [Vicinamibacterales bacterium]